MKDPVTYASKLLERGYWPYPVNATLDSKGDKSLRFKDDRWAAGEYPSDPDAIRRHWTGYDGLMINTGKSGLVVVDIDVKQGRSGFTNMSDQGIRLPDTPVSAKTPSGGRHLYYREPEGLSVKTTQNELAELVDTRARGGLVLAAPTLIAGRGEYTFESKVLPVADLPEFPRELAERLATRAPEIPTRERSAERPLVTAEKREWLEKTADKCLRDIRRMEDGERFGTMQRRMVRLYGIAMTLDDDLDIIDAQVRGAYYASGGVDTSQLEGWIRWARDHADYEDVEDEDREAEIQAGIRREQIKKEVRNRLNPVQTTDITDDDVLTFDGATGSRFWVDKWLPMGSTTILFAPPNTGKSFAAIDLACGIASGTKAWGRKVPQGKVLYLAGEGHAGLPLRQRVWEEWQGVSVGAELELRKMKLLLRDEDSVASHARLVKDSGADVIIVDTLMRATSGMTLENPGEASLAIRHLDMIREAAGPNAALLVLHHPAKHNPDKPAGSFPIEGNVDTIIGMRERPDDHVLTLWLDKARDDGKNEFVQFKPEPVEVPGTNRGALVLEPHEDGGGVTYI